MTMIRTIHIRGFKSLAEETLELGRINCFIGANGVGKSNRCRPMPSTARTRRPCRSAGGESAGCVSYAGRATGGACGRTHCMPQAAQSAVPTHKTPTPTAAAPAKRKAEGSAEAETTRPHAAENTLIESTAPSR